MKRSLALAVAALTTALVALLPGHSASASSPAPTCTGRCEQVAVPVPASVHVTSNQVRILLPAGYASSTTKYPVVYLLCGAAGDETEWTTKSDITSFTSTMKAIFVMPDCGGAAGVPGWYSDWADGQYQWETYYINVLMPWVAQHLRTIAGDNAIAGLSMGGYGALDLAARHPSLFKAVASFSGLTDTQYGQPATDDVVSSSVWGSPSTDSSNWTAHNPAKQVSKLAGKDLYLSSGTGGTDAQITDALGSAATLEDRTGKLAEENYIFQTNVSLVAALEQAKIPFHQDYYAGGSHTWSYFQQQAHWALPLIVADLTS